MPLLDITLLLAVNVLSIMLGMLVSGLTDVHPNLQELIYIKYFSVVLSVLLTIIMIVTYKQKRKFEREIQQFIKEHGTIIITRGDEGDKSGSEEGSSEIR